MNIVIKEKGLNIKIHTRKWNFCYTRYCKINKRKEGNNFSR
jgi:hypothetical protein